MFYRSSNNRDRNSTLSQIAVSTGSGDIVNTGYYRPQPYEETQIQEPEYSYAALAGDANVYDSVMEQSRGTVVTIKTMVNHHLEQTTKSDVPQEAYYSMCENGQ